MRPPQRPPLQLLLGSKRQPHLLGASPRARRARRTAPTAPLRRARRTAPTAPLRRARRARKTRMSPKKLKRPPQRPPLQLLLEKGSKRQPHLLETLAWARRAPPRRARRTALTAPARRAPARRARRARRVPTPTPTPTRQTKHVVCANSSTRTEQREQAWYLLSYYL